MCRAEMLSISGRIPTAWRCRADSHTTRLVRKASSSKVVIKSDSPTVTPRKSATAPSMGAAQYRRGVPSGRRRIPPIPVVDASVRILG